MGFLMDTEALAEAGCATLSEPGAVFADPRRRSEGRHDWTILQYGDVILSQAKS